MGSLFARAKGFLLGPEFISITADLNADLENTLAKCQEAVPAPAEDGAVVEVSLEAPGQEKAKLPPPPMLGSAAFKCTSALGKQMQAKSIAEFDREKQVYTKNELSPLPFQPPAFHTYAISMLSGTFKVFQYVVTVMVALMVMQHAVERYWSLQNTTSSWQALLFFMFISYPVVTLMLVVLTNNEMAIRRFMYYRLMSMQVIVDFENTSFFRLWFFIYYAASFILLMAYSFWAGWLTSEDKTISVWPQMSIVLMQSILLFMFWLNIVGMEEQLVPLNKVIENSPNSAKELIQHCDVIEEFQLKAAITNTYKRKKAFKRLSHADQDREGKQLLETGDSAAAFFDLNSLRSHSKRRTTKDLPAAEEEPASQNCYCVWLHKLGDWVDEILWRKLYALIFATSFFSVSMFRMHRSGRDRAHATFWPYPADVKYFKSMAVLSGICAFMTVAVEAYAIWFVVFAKDITDRDRYGILECKMCYQYQAAAGATCSMKPVTSACWGAAKRGYCSMFDALVNNYAFNATQIQTWDTAACAPYLS